MRIFSIVDRYQLLMENNVMRHFVSFVQIGILFLLAFMSISYYDNSVLADFSHGGTVNLLAPHPKKAQGSTKADTEGKSVTTDGKDAKKDDSAKPEAGKETEKKENGAKADAKKDDLKKDPSAKVETSPKDETKKEEPKPDTIELKKEPLRLTVKINGLFESKKAEAVRLKGEDFGDFELKKTIPHGAKVRKGDVLIEFDPKKYEEALVEKKRALRLSEMSLKEEEINLKYLGLRHPLNKETFERSKKYDDEDLLYYFNVEQEWMKKMSGFRMKIAQFYVDNAKEELKQLEKMYAEDDLIEETEEFILKRSKFMVEVEEFFYEMDKMYSDRTLEVALPRMNVRMRHSAKLRELDYRRTRETFDFVLEQTKLRYEKAKETHGKLVEQYKKFTKDKQLLTLKSPADGIVYYGEYNGEFSRGKWNNAAAVASGMKVKEVIKNNQVLFTIVDPKPTVIRIAVAEKELHWINAGTQGIVTPTAFPNDRYKVKVTQRNSVPSPSNDYVAILSVEMPDDAKVYPNMSGSVELTVYDKKETLLVPTAALKREEMEEDSWNHAYLYVYEEGKKEAVKKKVKTGQVKGDKTELIGGIATGTKVYKKFDDGEKAVEKAKEDAEKAKKEKAEKERAEKEAKVKAEKEKAEKEKAEKAAKEKKEAESQKQKKEKKPREKKEPKKDEQEKSE